MPHLITIVVLETQDLTPDFTWPHLSYLWGAMGLDRTKAVGMRQVCQTINAIGPLLRCVN
jgi:hypothetical protein